MRRLRHKLSSIFIGAILLFQATSIYADHLPGGPNPPEEANSVAYEETLIQILQGIAEYSFPGIGVDKNSYLPFDHVRIDPDTSRTFTRGTYSAAAKVAAYIIFLLKTYEGEDYYESITLPYDEEEKKFLMTNFSLEPNNRSVALLRLHRMFNTVYGCLVNETEAQKAPYLSGMLAWLSINRDGNVTRDKDLVPLLDNGLLSWSYAALIGILAEEESPFAKEVYEQSKALLDLQKYDLFLNRKAKQFYGEIDVNNGCGNPGYMLERLWTEDVLSVLWGLFTIDIPEEEKISIWNHLLTPVMEYETISGEVIDVPVGYVSSNHEIIWTLAYVPFLDSPISALYMNTQHMQADFAKRINVPGFQSVSYNPIGAYMKMGVPDVSEYPDYVQTTDNACTFATATGLLVDANHGKMWLSSLVDNYKLLTKYGPVESVGPAGRADILSADSQYLIASAIGGGVRQEVKRYLKGKKVKGSDDNCYDFMYRLFDIAHKRILASQNIDSVRVPSHPFPDPPNPEYDYDNVEYPPQDPEFEILDNLSESGDDCHGSNVHSVDYKNRRWEVTEDEMLVAYTIPVELTKYYRFAWWGTYMGKNRPYPAAYTDVSVTVLNDGAEQRFRLFLKREDSSLVKPIEIDTAKSGQLSKDGKWKTYTFPLKQRKRFVRFPLTYISFSVEDPKKNEGYYFEGSVKIKSIKLINRHHKKGKIDVQDAIDKIGTMPPYVSPQDRPVGVEGEKPRFFDSGVIGEATEDITREEKEQLYFEFEDVDPFKGFTGIWTICKDIELGKYKYIVFDVLKGAMKEVPELLRMEFKHQSGEGLEENPEDVVFSYNINLSQRDISEDKWLRFVVPLPKSLEGQKINMLNFICENWIEKLTSGSLTISRPIFAEEVSEEIMNADRVVRPSKRIKDGQSLSLLPFWQIDQGRAIHRDKAEISHMNENERSIEVKGKGGWIGAGIYPSILHEYLGNMLVVEIQPLTDGPCSGVIELKEGRLVLAKTPRFVINDRSGKTQRPGATYYFIYPLEPNPDTDQVNYIAVSNIVGHYKIKDISIFNSKTPDREIPKDGEHPDQGIYVKKTFTRTSDQMYAL
ncbi:MAG: hypothetical protein ABID09_04215 [Candidatus Omnitrophota bacterium]